MLPPWASTGKVPLHTDAANETGPMAMADGAPALKAGGCVPSSRPMSRIYRELPPPGTKVIGERSESTDQRVSLHVALRDFGVAV